MRDRGGPGGIFSVPRLVWVRLRTHCGLRAQRPGTPLLGQQTEVDLYAGDLTRTYPVSGHFTGEQRDVYETVLSARSAALEQIRPGNTVSSVHEMTVRTLVKGLVELGVLNGKIEDLVAGEAYKPFFPHRTMHWLGLDVHDPGDYATSEGPRMLEEGMVLTVEPGLYFRKSRPTDAESDYDGIGMRVEDDVLVTSDGGEVLSAALPVAADDVEALARQATSPTATLSPSVTDLPSESKGS